MRKRLSIIERDGANAGTNFVFPRLSISSRWMLLEALVLLGSHLLTHLRNLHTSNILLVIF